MMQGDTFHILVEDLKEARQGTHGEAGEALDGLIEMRGQVRRFYEETVEANGFRIPYR